MVDYYKTLGVARSATQEEIKKAYRLMAMKYHPDKNKGCVNAENKFKSILKAYDVLKDPSERRRYDMNGSSFYNNSGFANTNNHYGNFYNDGRYKTGEQNFWNHSFYSNNFYKRSTSNQEQSDDPQMKMSGFSKVYACILPFIFFNFLSGIFRFSFGGLFTLIFVGWFFISIYKSFVKASKG